MMKTLGALPQEEKIAMGKTLNILKGEIEKALAAQKAVLEAKELNDRLASETVDVTLPVRPENQGRLHPISQIYEEVVAIFGQMGFSVAEGPDIEDQFHNFNALNMPANHPARQMQDTFYIPNPESDDLTTVMWCGRIRHRFRFGQWKRKSCRSALLRRGGHIVRIMMRHIPRCFTKSRDWLLTPILLWRI